MITVLCAVIADTSIHASPADTTSSTSEQNSIVIIDDSSVSEHDANHSNKVDFICDVFSGNIVAMTMIVFAALFAGAYRRTGYEKNVVCSVRRRWYFVASNAVICLLVCVLTVLLLLGASALSNMFIIARYANLPFWIDLEIGPFRRLVLRIASMRDVCDVVLHPPLQKPCHRDRCCFGVWKRNRVRHSQPSSRSPAWAKL